MTLIAAMQKMPVISHTADNGHFIKHIQQKWVKISGVRRIRPHAHDYGIQNL